MRRASHDSIRVDVMAEVGRRIFIACEGYRTEVEYFTTICRNRRRYGITDPVDIVVLNRLRTNVGDSDPDAVLRLTREYLGFLTTGVCRIGLFLNYIQDRMEVSEGLRGAIIGCLETNGLIIDGDVVDVPQAQSKVEEMLASIGYNISIGIINQTPYMDGKDDVFIVVDRDKSDARDSTKYFNFIRDCKEAGFVPVVTNPKFELWMLMHTADSRESVKRVVDSRNPSAQVDHEMRDAGLRKNRVDYVSLLEGLDSAMEVSVPYRLDPERLESCVGTGVPKLIESMRISDRGAWALNKDVSC